MMSNYIIETNNLTKKFGKFTAVNNLELKVTKGKIHGFVGPNGAGKTTTIKMLIGAIKPSTGNGIVLDKNIGSIDARRLIGYAPEKSHFYPNMTAIEYLVYMGKLSGLSERKAFQKSVELLKLFELVDAMYRKPVDFSSGMKKKVVVAQALLNDPEILILDEPTANLDPTSRLFILDIIKKLVHERNLTVFISSHILTELELLVDEVTLINKGNIVLSGDITTIKDKFKQNRIHIHTDNNDILIDALNQMSFVERVIKQEENVVVFANDNQKLSSFIGPILAHFNLELYKYSDEKITLDNIYKNIFELGEQEL